mmetsp:Transcript_14182/g.28445  ORF Transcript_14182/g.28445 Transcript_14182/m.28445 type:complete len:197 (+) Transcript_14182:113-703(+)
MMLCVVLLALFCASVSGFHLQGHRVVPSRSSSRMATRLLQATAEAAAPETATAEGKVVRKKVIKKIKKKVAQTAKPLDELPKVGPAYFYAIVPEREFLYEEPTEEILRERSMCTTRDGQPFDFWVLEHPYFLSNLASEGQVRLASHLGLKGEKTFTILTTDFEYVRYLKVRLRDTMIGGPLRFTEVPQLAPPNSSS